MPRIRTIKPEFPQSESMGRVSRDARLLFVLLWTLCDDEGRTRAASRMLASLLFPYDEDAPKRIDGWLKELEGQRCIVRYSADGATYLQVCNWLMHQKIDKPSKSKIPPFANVREDSANAREDSSGDQGSKDQGSRIEGSKDQGGGDGNGGNVPESFHASLPVDAWDEWLAYRRTRRWPCGPQTLKRHLTLLAKYDAETQRSIIDASINSGWQGLFDPKGGKHAPRPTRYEELMSRLDAPAVPQLSDSAKFLLGTKQ
jgi:hypothetical protein